MAAIPGRKPVTSEQPRAGDSRLQEGFSRYTFFWTFFFLHLGKPPAHAGSVLGMGFMGLA